MNTGARKVLIKNVVVSTAAACFFVAGSIILSFAGELETVKLAAPRIDKDHPFLEVLKNRSTRREFSTRDLSLQELSDLLWAADGINRPESGKRTAPSAMDMQEIDIYVATAKGLYLYDAKNALLVMKITGDIREITGRQPFVKDAPVNLIYVADFSRMSRLSAEARDFYAAADTGFISENVYLYCSSSGLATVVRGLFDRAALEKAMRLRPDQRVILTQTVGYPG